MADREAKKTTAPATATAESGGNMAQIQDVDVEVSVELGRSTITLDQALEMGEQSLMELNRHVGEPVDVRLNGKLFAPLWGRASWRSSRQDCRPMCRTGSPP